MSAADTDGDTLEDWWEVMNGLDPNDASDALADADGDSVPAWLERAAGTHPQMDDSPLYDYVRELITPGSLATPMVFRHPSQGTLSLQLSGQASADLDAWSALPPGPSITGDIFSNDFLFTISPGPASPYFFRMKTEP
jgi:hypothetical protein